MFGKLFGRGKSKRDAFGVETSDSVPAIVGSETTTTVTTTSTDVPLGAGMDLGAILATVRDAQEQAGGDREAMADLLRARLGDDVVVDQQSSVETDWTVVPQQQDPIELLATLTELHEKGVVSDEQFEAQKRRLLG